MSKTRSLTQPGPQGRRSRHLGGPGHLQRARGEAAGPWALGLDAAPRALPAICSPSLTVLALGFPLVSCPVLSFIQQSVPRRRHVDKKINRQYRSQAS